MEIISNNVQTYVSYQIKATKTFTNSSPTNLIISVILLQGLASLIASSTVPLVFVLQIVLYREEEVLECECDMAMVHHLLSQIPQDLPYETLISRAGDLFVQFPPSELAREAVAHDRYLNHDFTDTCAL